MDIKELKEKRERIILLDNEIKSIASKKEELKRLNNEYYNDYFDLEREKYSLLTELPINESHTKHILYDYSGLNVDTIGELICKLMKKYDHMDCISRRVIRHERWDNRFGYYDVELPRLVIGTKEDVEEEDNTLIKDPDDSENEKVIIIKYSDSTNLKDYPTDKPVKWIKSSSGDSFERSNYKHFIALYDGLTFDSHNKEYIKELIYSLAYYQKQCDIKYMSRKETIDVFNKIYNKVK